MSSTSPSERAEVSSDSRAPLLRRPNLSESGAPKLYANTSSAAVRQALHELRGKVAEQNKKIEEQDKKIAEKDQKIAAQDVLFSEQNTKIAELYTLIRKNTDAIDENKTEVRKVREGLATNECDLDERSIEYTKGINDLRTEFYKKSTNWVADIGLLGRKVNTLDADVTTLFTHSGKKRKADPIKSSSPMIDLVGSKAQPKKKCRKREETDSESSSEPRKGRRKR